MTLAKLSDEHQALPAPGPAFSLKFAVDDSVCEAILRRKSQRCRCTVRTGDLESSFGQGALETPPAERGGAGQKECSERSCVSSR